MQIYGKANEHNTLSNKGYNKYFKNLLDFFFFFVYWNKIYKQNKNLTL
jgi:hypothetical protein